MKQGILVVSFGTSHEETRVKTIGAVEEAVKKTYPGLPVGSAYTSPTIRRILAARGLEIDCLGKAIERMKEQGVEELIVQPTHLICGEEFDKLKETVDRHKSEFAEVRLGWPLLHDTEDLHRVARIIGQAYPAREGQAVVMMGHGTEHTINAVYPAMDYVFKECGFSHIYVATVEGYPQVSTVISLLKEKKIREVVLAPLMLVAGDHARNDMAGDEEDSWKNLFAKEGFQVRCVLKGLGEEEAIRALYLEHLSAAINA